MELSSLRWEVKSTTDSSGGAFSLILKVRHRAETKQLVVALWYLVLAEGFYGPCPSRVGFDL